MANKKPRFLRSDTGRHLRLGKKKQRLQKWRKARGRHSKIRRKHTGYPVGPSIGYGNRRSEEGLLKGKKPVVFNNMKELVAINKQTEIGIVSRRIGARKRLDLIKKAREIGIMLHNVQENKQ